MVNERVHIPLELHNVRVHSTRLHACIEWIIYDWHGIEMVGNFMERNSETMEQRPIYAREHSRENPMRNESDDQSNSDYGVASGRFYFCCKWAHSWVQRRLFRSIFGTANVSGLSEKTFNTFWLGFSIWIAVKTVQQLETRFFRHAKMKTNGNSTQFPHFVASIYWFNFLIKLFHVE